MRTLLARDAEDECDLVSSSNSSMVRLLAETERVSRRDRGGLGKISTDDSSSELLNPSPSANASKIRNHEKHASRQVNTPTCVHLPIVLEATFATVAVIQCS